MDIAAIDRTIGLLCDEIYHNYHGVRNWQCLTEEELLYEACVCMLSSQMVFEVAEAATQRLRERGLLRPSRNRRKYEQRLCMALSEPLAIERDGKVQHFRPRFRNRQASLLATTVTTMETEGQSFRRILSSTDSAYEARKILVNKVWGFGPKQASLFLRRVGFSAQLAVLDTHILDYLRLAQGIDPKPSALSRVPGYELIEAEFQNIAAKFGYSVGCVDLAIWITMRVAKREVVW